MQGFTHAFFSRLPQAGGAPKVMEGDTEAGLNSSQPGLQQEGGEFQEKRNSYLCGLNVGFGNSRGIGKN